MVFLGDVKFLKLKLFEYKKDTTKTKWNKS